jgi:hypothetical protein
VTLLISASAESVGETQEHQAKPGTVTSRALGERGKGAGHG